MGIGRTGGTRSGTAHRRSMAAVVVASIIAAACTSGTDEGSAGTVEPDPTGVPTTTIAETTTTTTTEPAPDTTTSTTTTTTTEPPGFDLDAVSVEHRREEFPLGPTPMSLVSAGLVAGGRAAMSVGMSRSVEWAAARLGLHAGLGSPITAEVVAGAESCVLMGNRVRAQAPGRCGVRITTTMGAGLIDMEVLPAPERTEVDRPGPNVLDLKPIYIRFSDSPDLERDVNGEVATFVQDLADFYATQHPGHTLRVDHVDGVPDVLYVELPITTAEFAEGWTDNLGPLADLLRDAGIGEDWREFYEALTGGPLRGYEALRRLYVGVVEGPRGAYTSPNNTIEGGCGSSSGHAFVVYFVRDLDGRECLHGAFPFEYQGAGDAHWQGFDALRLALDPLNGNHGCDAVIHSQWTVPLEERPGSLTPVTDVIAYGYRGAELPRQFDPERRYYFRIEEGPWVGDPCRDLAFSPFVTDVRQDTRPDDERPGRSMVDRPDEVDGPQVRVLYVLPADSPDVGWDVDGTLHRQMEAANDWLFANGGQRIVFDTFEGELDVTFVRLPLGEAELWLTPFSTGRKCGVDELCPHPRDLMPVLAEMGALSDDKVHVVVYGGGFNPALRSRGLGCAGAIEVAAFMKPALRSLMDGVYQGCHPTGLATSPDSENSFGLVVVHELFHVMGAVSRGAPDSDGDYHIGNDPSDLMGGSFGTVRLDPERRNYWGHGRTDIVDVTRSVLLTPTVDDPELPPSWNHWTR